MCLAASAPHCSACPTSRPKPSRGRFPALTSGCAARCWSSRHRNATPICGECCPRKQQRVRSLDQWLPSFALEAGARLRPRLSAVVQFKTIRSTTLDRPGRVHHLSSSPQAADALRSLPGAARDLRRCARTAAMITVSSLARDDLGLAAGRSRRAGARPPIGVRSVTATRATAASSLGCRDTCVHLGAG